MQSEITEYIPPQRPAKIFNLTPAEDQVSLVAIQARLYCLRDRNLSYGARCLFAFLLDQSLNPYTHLGKGVVSVSATKISENLGCYENTIFKWIGQLELGRHIWKDKQFMPNFWAMNRYHITAFDPPDAPSQLPTRDGMWGNGVRRPEAPKGTFSPPPLSKTTRQNADELLQPVGNHGPGNSKTTADASPKPRRGAVEKPLLTAVEKPRRGAVEKPRLAAVEKPRPTAGENHAPGIAETTDIRESQAEGETQKVPLSCLTAERVSGLAASRKRNTGERDWLERLGRIVGPKELANWGGRWRNRYREDSDKAGRVLAELTNMQREGLIHTNPGACADHLWKQFASRKAVGK
jgi:hypothetical protein